MDLQVKSTKLAYQNCGRTERIDRECHKNIEGDRDKEREKAYSGLSCYCFLLY